MKQALVARRGVRLKIVAVGCLVGTLLADATVAPAETIRVPETLMRSVSFDGARGRVALSLRPTHVGFTWRGSHDARVSYRTLDESGRPSKWRVAPMDHDMETGSRRYTGLIEVDRPAGIGYRKELRAEDGDAGWMGPVTMESINALDGPKREIALTGSAPTNPGAPSIVTRAEWGADESIKRSSGACERTFHPVRQLFVHHTAGSNQDYNGAATMRAIYAYHTRSRGWCDVGYNFLIDWSGTIFEGRWARPYADWEAHDSEDHRDYAVAGAHVAGFNSGSVGISLMGNFTTVGPPPAMKQSLKAMLAWEADRHDLSPTGTHTFNGRVLRVIGGHRDAGQTACPGNKLYNQLPKFRRRVEAMIGEGHPATKLKLGVTSARVPFGQAVETRGTLQDASGQPLSQRPVTIYRRYKGGKWSQLSSVTTGSKGGFSAALAPRRKVALAASFATDQGYWESNSRVVRVSVKHLVIMTPNDRDADSGGLYRYKSTEKRANISGRVRPSHEGKTVRVRLFRRMKDGSYDRVVQRWSTLDSSGRFTHSFFLPVRKAGTRYRIAAAMPKDGAHLGGWSGSRHLVVD